MTEPTGDPELRGTTGQPTAPTVPVIQQTVHDLQAVNAQLLIAGVREQGLAEQLRRQLAVITAITTSISEGVYGLDSTGRCTFVNPAAEQLLGWSGDQLRGQPIRAVFPSNVTHGTANDAIPPPLVNVLQRGITWRDEDAVFVHQNGSLLQTAYAAAPILTDEQVIGAVMTFRDVTDVRRLQQLREEYLTLISHDLRGPLTALLGRAQILARRLAKQGLTRDAQNANIVIESGFRIDAMIEDVLVRSRSDAAMRVRHRSTVDLVAVVQKMLDYMLAPDDRERITLAAGKPLLVAADVLQIERVMGNLLTNALKFSPPGTPIMVQVYQHGAEAVLAVMDQGIGIAQADLPHLFDKRYRADTVEQVAGEGLGLYSSRMIVEAHGGRLWAESVPGAGSTFLVALPLLA